MRALLLLAVAGAAAAQPVAFDVASIKPAAPPTPGLSRSNRATATGVDYQNATLRFCIAFAYGVKDYQISAPAWLNEDRWEIHAKAPEGATRDQFPAMMQTLLAERFHFQIHRDQKEFDGLVLTVGKNGPKMEKAAAGASSGFRTMFRFGGGGNIETRNMTMAMLASMLTNILGRPVADETGLEAPYAFTVEYAAYETNGNVGVRVVGGDAPPVSADADPGVSVLKSVQKLGLKLEQKKVTLDRIVVDQASKTPTEN